MIPLVNAVGRSESDDREPKVGWLNYNMYADAHWQLKDSPERLSLLRASGHVLARNNHGTRYEFLHPCPPAFVVVHEVKRPFG